MTEVNFADRFVHLKAMAKEFCALDHMYVYAHIKRTGEDKAIEAPTHKNTGMSVLLVKNGSIGLEFNMERYTVDDNCFVVIPHGAMVSLFDVGDGWNDIYVISFSTEFLHTVNINFSAISIPTFIDKQSPAEPLTEEECQLVLKYFDLLKLNAEAGVNDQVESNIASSLVAALVYQLVQIHYKRIGSGKSERGQKSCRNAYVHDFLKLVHVHYSQERSIKFYADKLCISPKYLSLLVKETTGKSASRWIDEFVLMEAKNLLRFSSKNVQQVAYALNFSNQSSFGKYFKHMTGQSPTEYQKS